MKAFVLCLLLLPQYLYAFEYFEAPKCDVVAEEVRNCYYSSQFLTADELIQAMQDVLRPQGISINNIDGYMKRGNAKYLLNFYHKDPEVLALMMELVQKLDRVPLPNRDRQKVMVEINYYYLSNQEAEERGFSLDFLFDGLVSPDLPRASHSSDTGFGINFGNLSNYWFGFNMNYAKNQGMIQLQETIKFESFNGRQMDFIEKTRIYRDGTTATDNEDSSKYITGKIFIDETESGIVHIRDFNMVYPTAINTAYSILSERKRYEPEIEFRMGDTAIVWHEEVKEYRTDENGKIIGWADSSGIRTSKFLVTIKISPKRNFRRQENGIEYNERKQIFSFSDTKKNEFPVLSQNFSEIFHPKHMDLNVYSSPFGAIANGVQIQFSPESLSQNNLNTPIRMEIFGDGIETQGLYKIENLIAGPVSISEFDPQKNKSSIQEGKPVRFLVRLEVEPSIAKVMAKRGLGLNTMDYLFYYYPSLDDILLVKTYQHEGEANISLKRMFKRDVD